MSDEMIAACRLLIECGDELRLHDEEYRRVTRQDLKDRLLAFLTEHGMVTPEVRNNLVKVPHA